MMKWVGIAVGLTLLAVFSFGIVGAPKVEKVKAE